MEAETINWTLILAGASLALGLFPLGRLLFRININAPMFATAIQKLIAADNLDRAIKLSRAAPAAPLANGTRALLEAYQEGIRDSLALKEAFETGAGGLKRTIGKFTWMSYTGLALFLLAAGFAFALGFNLRPEEGGLGLAAFVVSFLGITKALGFRRQAEMARDQMINFLLEWEAKK